MTAPQEEGQPAGPVTGIGRHPFVLLTLAMLFWGGNSVLGRAVSDSVPAIGLAWWRWAVALVILLAVAAPQIRRDLPVMRARWRLLLLLGCLGTAAFNTLLYLGLNHTTAINGLTVMTTMPVVIVALSWLLFRDRVAPGQATGILLSMAGALIIIARGDGGRLAGLHLNPGDLLIAAATLCYAAYSALLRLQPAVHAISLVAGLCLSAVVVLAPFYAWESLVAGRPMPVSWTAVGAIAYVGLFPSILAFLCFNRGVALVGANRAAPFFHLQTVFGVLLSMVLLGETLAPYHLIGLVLIAPGLYLAARTP